MKNIKNIFRKLTGFLQGDRNTHPLATTYNLGGGSDNYSDIANMGNYRKNLYLFKGVSMVAGKLSTIALDLYRIKNSNGEFEEVFNDRFVEVLNNPNPRETRKQFMERAAVYYLLSGDAIWLLDRIENTDEVIAMYNLRPDKVRIVTNTKGDILFYEYINGSVTTKVAVEDIMHTKTVDPLSDLRGLGVLSPVSQRIATEAEVSKTQNETYRTRGRTEVIALIDGDVDADEVDDVQKEWELKYGRGGNTSGVGFLAGVKQLFNISTPNKDLQTIEMQNFLRDDIMFGLNIPKAMYTSDDVNLANAETGRKIYLEEAVLPVLDAFVDTINNAYLTKYKQGDLFVDYDSPMPEDRKALIEEAAAGYGKYLTTNHIQEMLGYPITAGGDVIATPAAFSFAEIKRLKTGKAVLKRRRKTMLRLVAQDKMAKAMALQKQLTTYKPKLKTMVEQKNFKAFAAAYNKGVDARAKELAPAVEELFKTFGDKVIEANKEAVIGIPDGLKNELQQIAGSRMTKELTDIYKRAGKQTMETLFNVLSKVSTKDAQNVALETFIAFPEMLNNIEARARFFAESFTKTNYEKLQATITAGVNNGDSVDTIGRTIRNTVEEMSVARGKTIARTETGYAMSLATSDAYNQSSVVDGKQWVTAGDTKVRAAHQQNEAQGVIPKTAAFYSNESYPAEKSVNCRCALVPAVKV